MQELSEAPELSQRAVYADVCGICSVWMPHTYHNQIFGFKYTMSHSAIQFDPNGEVNLRYRLFARAIRINGLADIRALQPYLHARLRKTFDAKLSPQMLTNGLNYPRFIKDQLTIL